MEPNVCGQVQPGVGAARGRSQAAHRRGVPHRKRGYPELLRPALLAQSITSVREQAPRRPVCPAGRSRSGEAIVPSWPYSPECVEVEFSEVHIPALCVVLCRTSKLWPTIRKIQIIRTGCIMAPERIGAPDRGSTRTRTTFVPLDAALYDPLPLGISVSYKRGETEKAMASPHGWHIFERGNIAGVVRTEPRCSRGADSQSSSVPSTPIGKWSEYPSSSTRLPMPPKSRGMW